MRLVISCKETHRIPHWNWRMLCHIYVADRLALNNRNAKKTKEIGVRMWRTAYPNSTGDRILQKNFTVLQKFSKVACCTLTCQPALSPTCQPVTCHSGDPTWNLSNLSNCVSYTPNQRRRGCGPRKFIGSPPQTPTSRPIKNPCGATV